MKSERGPCGAQMDFSLKLSSKLQMLIFQLSYLTFIFASAFYHGRWFYDCDQETARFSIAIKTVKLELTKVLLTYEN